MVPVLRSEPVRFVLCLHHQLWCLGAERCHHLMQEDAQGAQLYRITEKFELKGTLKGHLTAPR